MAEVSTTICDLCGEPAVTRVGISEGRKAEFIVDLCVKHAVPIEELRQHGRSAEAGRRAYRRFTKVDIEE